MWFIGLCENDSLQPENVAGDKENKLCTSVACARVHQHLAVTNLSENSKKLRNYI